MFKWSYPTETSGVSGGFMQRPDAGGRKTQTLKWYLMVSIDTGLRSAKPTLIDVHAGPSELAYGTNIFNN